MRNFLFTPVAFEQYNEWQTENKQVFNKLKKLLKEIGVFVMRFSNSAIFQAALQRSGLSEAKFCLAHASY